MLCDRSWPYHVYFFFSGCYDHDYHLRLLSTVLPTSLPIPSLNNHTTRRKTANLFASLQARRTYSIGLTITVRLWPDHAFCVLLYQEERSWVSGVPYRCLIIAMPTTTTPMPAPTPTPTMKATMGPSQQASKVGPPDASVSGKPNNHEEEVEGGAAAAPWSSSATSHRHQLMQRRAMIISMLNSLKPSLAEQYQNMGGPIGGRFLYDMRWMMIIMIMVIAVVIWI